MEDLAKKIRMRNSKQMLVNCSLNILHDVGWSGLYNSTCMISRGFIVSFRLLEMDCRDTVRPWVLVGPAQYTLWGKAKRNATDATNISIQMKKFCQPADTVPTPTACEP